MEKYKTIDLMMVILYKTNLSYFEVCMHACARTHTHKYLSGLRVWEWAE